MVDIKTVITIYKKYHAGVILTDEELQIYFSEVHGYTATMTSNKIAEIHRHKQIKELPS